MNRFFKQCTFVLLTGLMTLSVNAADYVPKILAGVIQSDDWGYNSPAEGFYELEVKANGSLTRLSKERDIYAAPLGGAVYENGKMYGIHYRAIDDPYYPSGYTYYAYSVEYDLKTYERIKSKTLGDMYMNLVSTAGMTHDPVTGNNYGFFMNPNMDFEILSRNLATIDFVSKDTPQKSKIREFDKSVSYCAMAAGEDGRLYVVDHNGYLYTLNKTNGSETLLGDLGVQNISTYPSSMTFDPRTQKLYWCFVDNSKKSYLYEINYKIGSVGATKITQIPGNAILVNMYIAAPEADDSAPAAVSDLTALFEGESYTGTVSFTMPSKTYDDGTLSGNLNYFILANDRQIATGTAAAGEKVEKTVTVPENLAGTTTIKVYASNNAGDGAPETVELYVGLDTPEAVPSVKLNYDNATMTANLTWTAPAKGLHGLTLTPSNLKYKVVRYPDAVTVATAQEGTSFSEKIDNTQPLKSYYYAVIPINGGKFTGDSSESNKAVVGVALNVPYSEYFTSDEGFDIFTVIDANKDGAKWERFHKVYQYSGTVADYARMDAHRDNADDDWLLLPPLNMRKGSVYELAFSAKKEYSGTGYNQLFEIKIGKDLNTDSYSLVMPSTQIYDVNFEDFTKELSVDEDGIYYIAFHAISKAGSGPLDLDYVKVTELASADGPKAVTNLSVTADPEGKLSAVATFKTPTESLHGETLTSISKVVVNDANGNKVGETLSPKPGATISVDLTVRINGKNIFTVIPYVGTNPGEPATIAAFVGEDIPQAPTNIRLEDNGEYAVLTWDVPSTGANGEYVNPETMKFNLGTIDEVWGTFVPLKNNVQSPYNTGVMSNEGEQSLLYYALRGETRAGQGEPAASNGLVVGEPYTAPYKMSFEQDFGPGRFVWVEGEYADWNMGRTNDISSDGDGYAFIFIPNRAEYGIFNLGKINLSSLAKPVLTFDYYVYPLSSTSIGVGVDVFPQGKAETLKTLSFYNRNDEGWHTETIDLSKYKDEKFVIIKFAMTSSSTQTPAVIDNLRIEDSTSGIENVNIDASAPFVIYSVDGRIISRNAESLKGLAPGVYIVNGRKHIVK